MCMTIYRSIGVLQTPKNTTLTEITMCVTMEIFVLRIGDRTARINREATSDEKETPQSRVQKPYMANQALLVAV